MDDVIGTLVLEVILHGFCYYTGKIILKILSFGRISIEPKRRFGKKEHSEEQSYRFGVSDSWTTGIGLAFWIGVAVIVAILMK
jgi:hypothetical protein